MKLKLAEDSLLTENQLSLGWQNRPEYLEKVAGDGWLSFDNYSSLKYRVDSLHVERDFRSVSKYVCVLIEFKKSIDNIDTAC
jgi:hypothetical protein